jgi:hypothetical protein
MEPLPPQQRLHTTTNGYPTVKGYSQAVRLIFFENKKDHRNQGGKQGIPPFSFSLVMCHGYIIRLAGMNRDIILTLGLTCKHVNFLGLTCTLLLEKVRLPAGVPSLVVIPSK